MFMMSSGPSIPSTKAGEILHQRRRRELAARLLAFEDQGREVGARRVNGRSEPGAAGTDNDNFFHILQDKGIRLLE